MSLSPARLRTVKVTTCQIDADSGTSHDGSESAPVQSAAGPSGPLAIGSAAASGEQEKGDLRMSDGKTRVAISSKAPSPTARWLRKLWIAFEQGPSGQQRLDTAWNSPMETEGLK